MGRVNDNAAAFRSGVISSSGPIQVFREKESRLTIFPIDPRVPPPLQGWKKSGRSSLIHPKIESNERGPSKDW